MRRLGPAVHCVIAAGLLAVAAPASAEGVRFGVEGAGSPVFPVGSYIESGGKQFKNSTGFNARASLILGNWFFGYEFTSLGNSDICASSCASGDFGTTKLHSFTANYHFYLVEKPIRFYILVGIGGVFGTLGSWPSDAQANNVYGMDLRAGLGFEFPIGDHFFISLEGRYRYLLTNNPMQDLTTTFVNTYLGGGNASDVFKETIQDAHIIQAILGIGMHF
jgi:hypothetical protein